MSRRWLRALTIAAVLLGSVAPAWAGSILDRVREARVVRCGGVSRPGLSAPGYGGAWEGLEVDVCRAVAVAVLGANGRAEFRPEVAESDMRRVSGGNDDVSFLTASEIVTDHLTGAVLPGPPVFYETHGVMVHADAHPTRLPELEGSMICAEPGTGPERSLHAYFAAKHLPFRFSMWQESEEMVDAYSVGRCPAIAGEMTTLAALKREADAAGHPSRILPDPLAVTPVLATTPTGDADWARIVNWTVMTLLAAETRAGDPANARALPLSGGALGLSEGWQAAVVAATGDYLDIYRRNLGADSRLDLPRGVNALCDAGGLMCPPFVE